MGFPSTTKVPGYCRQKSRGTAFVELNGKRHYLPGAYGSPESRAAYDAAIGEWIANGRGAQVPSTDTAHITTTQPPGPQRVGGKTVAELCAAYLPYAETYYQKDGQPTTQLRIIRDSFRILLRLFALTPVSEFGPKKLAVIRDQMIEKGWARTTVIKHLSAIKGTFRWGTEQEMVPGDVYHALLAMRGLKKGRTAARETAPIQEVSEEVVEQTLPHLSATVQAMVKFQLLTGARPGEVCMLRPMDIDRRGDVWVYTPRTHKNAHHGQSRAICIGPKAQEVIREYVKGAKADQCVFRSEESESYSQASYRRAIIRGCERAFVYPPGLERIMVKPTGRKTVERLETRQEWKKRLTPAQIEQVKEFRRSHRWHPNQLRHTAATRIRDRFAIDAAQIILGHSKPTTTAIYASNNVKKAAEVMRLVG